MKIWLQKSFSVFLIALFLFPQVEKAVHDYQHRNDFHCTATNTHFHQTEHHCTLCDYAPPVTTTYLFPDYTFKTYISFYKQLLPNSEVVYVSFPDYFFSLRAPPTVS